MLPKSVEIGRYLGTSFGESKHFCLIGGVCFVIGVVVGACTKVNVLTVNIDVYVNVTFSTAFFSAALDVLLFFVVACAASLIFYTLPLSGVAVIVRGILVARGCVIIIRVFGFSGWLFALLFYFPFHIIFTALLVVAASFAARRCHVCYLERRHALDGLSSILIVFAVAIFALIVIGCIYALIFIRLAVLL